MKSMSDLIEESGGNVIAATDEKPRAAMVAYHYAREMADFVGVDFVDRCTEDIFVDLLKAIKSEQKFREMMSWMLGSDNVLTQLSIIELVSDLRARAVEASLLESENRRLHHRLMKYEEEEGA